MRTLHFIIASLSLLATAIPASAQDHHHPPQDVAIHEQFYATWMMPDNPKKSCCNKADCYPTTIRYEGNQLFAKRREDGAWLPIPAEKVEHNRDNPDGRSHMCAPAPNASYAPNTIFCFTLGMGI